MAEVTPLNFVKVGPGGTFAPSGRRPANAEHVDGLLRFLEESGTNRVAIHFHGGLNKEEVGLNVAAFMRDLYAPEIHAITFVWETGFLETLHKNLADLDKSALFWRVVELVARYAAGKTGVARYAAGKTGVAHSKGLGQPLTPEEVQAELGKERPFDHLDKAGASSPTTAFAARGGAFEGDDEAMRMELEAQLEEEIQSDAVLSEALALEAAHTPLLSPQLPEAGAQAQAKGFVETAALVKAVASIVIRVAKRFRDKRDHGFYPTVIEETLRELSVAQNFGAWMWGGMKLAAERMWLSNEEISGSERHVGTYFLDGLAKLQAKRPELSVDLVGHSAGAIAICHLLRANAKRSPALRVRNVVFLAPACTSELFASEVVAAPQRFERFRMFTMSDAFEAQDVLVPGLYTRSLLYFVSGLLEGDADTPIAGMERFLSAQPPFNTPELLPLEQFTGAKGENRLVLSLSSKLNSGAPEGLRCDSAHHGDFDDLDKPTSLSLKWMLLETLAKEEDHAGQ